MGGRQTKRQRRADRVAAIDETYEDPDFGISVRPYRQRWAFQWVPDPDPGVALMGLGRYRALLEEAEQELVLVAREDGFSWDDVGLYLGVTGEAARKRHGDADRGREDGQR